MATFDGNDLKKWRKSLGVAAEVLAERISCDVTTIYRYESGKLHPDPDVMYQICRELGDPLKWHDWMRTEYPRSYGREHPEPEKHDLPGCVLSMYSILGELNDMQRGLFADAADGKIDDPKRRDMLRVLMENMISTGQAIKTLLPEGG